MADPIRPDANVISRAPDATVGETRPSELKPSELKPSEVKPSEVKPSDTKTAADAVEAKRDDSAKADYATGRPGAATGRGIKVTQLQQGERLDNPLLHITGLPDFAAIRPEHIAPGMGVVLADVSDMLADLEGDLDPTWEGLVEPLTLIGERLGKPWGAVGHLMAVSNSDALRTAYDAVQPQVVELSIQLSQSRALYDGLIALRDGRQWPHLDATQKRVVGKMIQDAELSGVGLTGAAKGEYNDIQRSMAKLKTEFGNNLLDATKAFKLELTDPAQVDGLPRSVLQQAAAAARENGVDSATADAGPWHLTLAGPLFVGFMKNSPRRELREQLYKAYVSRASAPPSDNTPLLTKILDLRQREAKLLGFGSFAEQSLSQKMAGSVKEVEGLLNELRLASWDPAHKELATLAAFAKKTGAPEAADLKPWDVSFFAERLREAEFSYTEEEVRQYLPMPKVLEGMFALASELFDVTVQEAKDRPSVWHDDVRFYEVLDRSGNPISAFYLDAYARPAQKRGGAWMDNVIDRRADDDGVRNPVAHIVCNGTPPEDGKDSMMAFREVETMFHEFGHALQHMLTTVDYPEAAGINLVEWDAVELPSQFMENWCYHQDTFLGLTSHGETGEPMPVELFDKIKSARTFRAASGMLRQLNFGLTDLELHHRYDPNGSDSPFDVHRRISETTAVMQPISEDRFLNGFSHIFKGGYSAGYFSYKWAEVLSADAFAAFEEAGLEDAEQRHAMGERFRSTVLAMGGSRHPMDVFKEFRGRAPSTEPLLRHAGLAPAQSSAS